MLFYFILYILILFYFIIHNSSSHGYDHHVIKVMKWINNNNNNYYCYKNILFKTDIISWLLIFISYLTKWWKWWTPASMQWYRIYSKRSLTILSICRMIRRHSSTIYWWQVSKDANSVLKLLLFRCPHKK